MLQNNLQNKKEKARTHQITASDNAMLDLSTYIKLKAARILY